MRFASIGIAAGSPSKRRDDRERRAGFTLVEALVALSLLLVFAAALGPVLSHGRRILARGDGQVRAQLLLRSLLESPFSASDPEISAREGESAGFRWRIAVEPFAAASVEPLSDASAGKPPYDWSLYKVTARVLWGDDQSVTAETLRLGRTE
jgi:prepilin-type N-terminal cleavage/methylation domain-containing protein